MLRYKRRSRVVDEGDSESMGGRDLDGSVVFKDAGYEQLRSPVSPGELGSFQRLNENAMNRANGDANGSGPNGSNWKNQEMQFTGGPGGNDLAVDDSIDMVEVTMLDDEDDEAAPMPQLQVLPPLPTLGTAFSLGSSPSSFDDSEFGSPETIVANASPENQKGKQKDEAYTAAVAQNLVEEPLMIAQADVTWGRRYLVSPVQHTIKRGNLPPPVSTIAETSGEKEIGETPSTLNAQGSQPPSPTRSKYGEDRMPRMINVAALETPDKESTLDVPRKLTSPDSGLSDLLSLYANRTENGDEFDAGTYELDDNPAAHVDETPDSPIPALGRKPTRRRTVRELENVATYKMKIGIGLKSGAASVVFEGEKEKQRGTFDSFLGLVDDVLADKEETK
jgi:hypothetical protein